METHPTSFEDRLKAHRAEMAAKLDRVRMARAEWIAKIRSKTKLELNDEQQAEKIADRLIEIWEDLLRKSCDENNTLAQADMTVLWEQITTTFERIYGKELFEKAKVHVNRITG